MENVVQEIIMIAIIVAIGIAIITFSVSVLYPQIVLTSQAQVASNIASETTLSVGPLLTNEGSGSMVVEVYNPAEEGNVSIIAFFVPQSYETSVSLVTPQSTSSLQVYLQNGKPAESLTLNRVYDLNGRLLYDGELKAYSVPFNSTVTLSVSGYQPGDVAVIWVMYGQGYTFRIGYTFTGVPS
ncbi:hypothetical protein [Metallosphaera sp.]|uniref:hypothetical protein n=1 Tax=Metallosphaera sp. TaxID=2020860 RepID=UPI003169E05F